MSVGLSNIADNYYQNYNKIASQSSGVGFQNVLSAKGVEDTTKTEQSFKDMWQSRYPKAKYHVMDAHKISPDIWGRTDFPFEKFFQDEVDDSILNWKPTGKEPPMDDAKVQARLNSTLGQKSIIVPPELEEKMKNNPELAKRVMAKVDHFIATHPTSPGSICSYLISLDENGEIAQFCVTGGGGFLGPTEKEVRQLRERKEERQEKEAEYMEILEETSFKRRENWQVNNNEYNRQNLLDKALESYNN